ncbi:LOW QUALITY PROTEIN: hypothetical protein MAR_000888 [Mya arenaria]|uniref:Uncharacterized protein n=1 Tax=Mya arenaria TaxID=6604 RepID=A0ABY7FAC4_MYAAR|nr:LOW QUALITY PROTEIN: hypothetical protein MAR_000888 [Mya arenaria]
MRNVEESIRDAEAIEYKRLNRLEGQKMIYDLWQSENEVDSAIKEISTKMETMEALNLTLGSMF